EVLNEVVCKQPAKDDSRLPINDSKELFTPARGLAILERSVLAFLGSLPHLAHGCVAGLVERLATTRDGSIFEECWFDGTTTLPLESLAEEIAWSTESLQRGLSATGIAPVLITCDVICTNRLNKILTHWNSKAAALGLALARFIDQ